FQSVPGLATRSIPEPQSSSSCTPLAGHQAHAPVHIKRRNRVLSCIVIPQLRTVLVFSRRAQIIRCWPISVSVVTICAVEELRVRSINMITGAFYLLGPDSPSVLILYKTTKEFGENERLLHEVANAARSPEPAARLGELQDVLVNTVFKVAPRLTKDAANVLSGASVARGLFACIDRRLNLVCPAFTASAPLTTFPASLSSFA
ncbi:MAG: hypothetical protein SGPRY_003468, partial [Prymnesium sp.]